ncbi:MAG: Asp/Glu/hydantoin racemase [Hyphomicrobiales bacterium]|nr:MAG: Asp/Glu/hydantoin racemase [Hyphomicrobiales bacterium]
MRFLVINPNCTASMTDTIAEAAEGAASAGTHIVARNPVGGPAAIQGPEDGTAALPGLFDLFRSEVLDTGAYDAAIIACFDDTGLWELKQRASIPVIGIGEAAFHAAMLVGQRFSVVTTLAVSVPVIEENLKRYGFAERCARVRASGVPVLDLENDPESSIRAIRNAISAAIAEDNCDAIVLGCAGMADLPLQLTEEFGLPVIDGVAAAISLAEAIHNCGAA